jgi:pimeloyl-ACP methyl ester carboxylesterase
MKRATILRWLKRLVLTVAVFVFLLFFVVLPFGASYLITNSRFRFPERDARTPEELGMPVENVEFASSDGVALKGWWNPGDATKPVIIFCHGLNRSRLELLERAVESNKRGYGVLLFDMRNHGESASAYTTLGINESQDVCGAQKFVKEKASGRPLASWGVSLGASTAILGAKRCGGFSAIVSDSAFLSFRDTIAHHFHLFFRLPSFPIANLIILITSLRMGIDPDDGDVEAAVRDIGIPVLFIAGSEDRRMPPEVAERMLNAATHPQKELLIVPGAGHGDAFQTDRNGYLNSVYKFLDQVRYNPALNGNIDKSGPGTPSNRPSPGGFVNFGRVSRSHH